MSLRNWLLFGFAIATAAITLTVVIIVIDPARNCDAHDAGVCRHNDSFEGCVWWRFVEGQIAEASEICAEKNSKLAVVENEDVYRKLVDNVTGGFNQTGYKVQLWTGMIFDPKKSKILTPEPCFVRWVSDCPTVGNNARSNIVLSVSEKAGNGMMNVDATTKQNGVLCQLIDASHEPK